MSEQNLSIQPISVALQEQVIRETNHLIKSAGDYFNRSFNEIPVLFDLSGKAAGMYRVKAGQRVIRYNPYIFSKYYDDNFSETIPHEVAHYVTDVLYGLRKIRPHGIEWKSVMQIFGVAPSRTASYDLSGLPVRNFQKHLYHCGCQNYELTSRRHNKILRGTGHYLCRDCGGKLLFVKNKDEK
ncbi:MAG: SprT-like domain-containing protein [Gammaproteobacteria bacterium]|nr:SprT-like domain-containing protein [Gammaproteobacteria bacterium]MCW8986548.1 SprT-like domain-containing protein [Gammaproteobacteria bacterium]